MLQDESLGLVFLQGLQASAAPLMLSTAIDSLARPVLAVLQDAEQAGYFYNDLLQILGQDKVLFYPSSYRRAVKYAQSDAANGILRTEVLARLARTTAEGNTEADRFVIVSCPEALSQLVVSKKRLEDKAIHLAVGDEVETDELMEQMREWGMQEQDYVYEPGQFAQRGSIIDVYSYSSELPFRIDFFGNEVDSIRTFDIESQLSKEIRQTADIVPELAGTAEKVPLSQSVFEHEFGTMRRVEFGPRPSATPSATLKFDISPQPLFHKNFSLLTQTLEDYLLQGYRLFILADSAKKTMRETIDLVHGAKDARGNEAETVLVTGDDVVNKTLPTILCDEEDVQGNHGATIGSIGPDQLNYLADRGLSRRSPARRPSSEPTSPTTSTRARRHKTCSPPQRSRVSRRAPTSRTSPSSRRTPRSSSSTPPPPRSAPRTCSLRSAASTRR